MEEEHAPREAAARPGRMRLVVGLLVGVLAFYLIVDSMMQGGAYFLTVEEAAAASLEPGRPVRIKGTVVAGSYQNPEGSNRHEFSIHGGDRVMQVTYDGPMPDVFAEGREVVVEGSLKESGVLAAHEVIAKCPSKYEGGQISDAVKKQMGHPGAETGAPSY